jgi:hypothetical protein
MLGENTGNGNELGVSSAIQGAVRLIHATANDFAILDEDTANWCFIAFEGKFSLLQ